ncbi:MAG: hypothetical protein ABIB71_06350 [Candidatus Woesearchaeota archaeon]
MREEYNYGIGGGRIGKERRILVLIALIGLLGIALLGKGITGMIALDPDDPTLKELCSLDNDCKSPDVCCLFYKQDTGICHSSGMCSAILALTENEVGNRVGALVPVMEDDKKEGNLLALAFGGLIVILTGLLAYYYISHHQVALHHVYRRKVHKAH